MRTRQSSAAGSRVRIALAMAAAVGAGGAILGALGGGAAAVAEPVSRTLTYTCLGYPLSVRIDADIPNSAEVGVATPRFKFDTVTTVGAAATRGASLVGVKTVEGTGQAKVNVSTPQGNTPITVPIDVPKTSVPTSGSGQISASGIAPSLTFNQPGRGKITIGDITLHIVPKNARGNLTVLGKLDLACKQDAGQDNVLMSFEIAKATTGPTTSGPPGPPPPGSTVPHPVSTTGPTTSGPPGPTPPGSTVPRPVSTTGPAAKNTTGTAVSGATTGPTATGAGSDSTSTTTDGTAGGTDGPVPTVTASSVGRAGTTAASDLDTVDLILPTLGILGLAAAALHFGPRLRNRRRRTDAHG